MTRVRGVALASTLAAVLVMILLFPASGIETDPPECYSVFDYVVPCPDRGGFVFSVAGSLLAAGMVVLGSVIGRWDRERS